MKKYALLAILPLLLALMMGCSGQQAQNANVQSGPTGVKLLISPITVVENKETVVTGETIVVPIGNATVNQTIPYYTYEPNKTLFVFFMNTTYISDWSQNATNERQGESILIKKGDANILIDAGPREAAGQLVSFLQQRGVGNIALLISTHARPENYGGMDAVFGNFTVQQFMWNGQSFADQDYLELVQKAQSKSGRVIVADYLYQTSINGIDFQAINPQNGSGKFYNIDNDGIVLRITDRNFCLMTTGDIAYGAQAAISTDPRINPRCDILQIPNYGLGQGTSNIDMLLLKVAPKSAIITGSYFDPANERYTIEEKLKLKGIAYYETFFSNLTSGNKTDRTLRITSDGYNYSIAAQG
jgi:competence protein ComEC